MEIKQNLTLHLLNNVVLYQQEIVFKTLKILIIFFLFSVDDYCI